MKNLTALVNSLKATTKTSEKETILATADAECQHLLKWAHNSFVTFGVTSKACKAHNEQASGYENLEELLCDLRDRKLTGHDAMSECNGFALSLDEEDRETFWGIIDRDLKTKVGVTSINNVFQGLIPTFEVALAQTASKASDKNKIDFDKHSYVVSRKLDGLRCVIIVDDFKAKAYTRSGGEYTTLDKVLKAVEETAVRTNRKSFVLDGEICIIDDNGNEDFQAITQVWNRKNHTIENPRFVGFDMLTLQEFYAEKGNTEYSVRVQNLEVFVNDCNNSTVSIVEFFKPKSNEELMELLNEVVKKGYEGLMVRKGCYEGKRTWNLQKLKKFEDAEYVIEGYDTEMTSYIKYVDNDGNVYLDKCDIPKGVEVKNVNAQDVMVKNIHFTHKGTKVSAGSGLTLKQKLSFMEDESLFMGKTVTIQYFEETKNSAGTTSLRFPVVKHIYEAGRNA